MTTTSAEPGSLLRAVVRQREYFDSVFLMGVSDRLSRLPGVREVAAVMATPANRRRLAEAGLLPPEAAAAGPDDLLIALRAATPDAADAALRALDEALRASAGPIGAAVTIDDAIARVPAANVAVISVPGADAADEARRAIAHGLHAFVFSSNVTRADELALKREAHARGLLLMGPDCGTSIIHGVGLGFANAVRRGPIGLVGASGTGLQEVSVLVHQAGSGVSHAIGTGSNDLSDDIGGITTLDALEALAQDPGTTVIVLVAKQVGMATRAVIDEAIARTGKPVVRCVFGEDARVTFESAAALALAYAGVPRGAVAAPADDVVPSLRAGLGVTQRSIVGLFAGGSFARQAAAILEADGIPASRVRITDLGAEAFTDGRPHPMIDPRLRRERILATADDVAAAVVLFDVILGHAAAPDPAGDLAEAINSARDGAVAAGRHLAFVASLTGTEGDPQGLAAQRAKLESCGVAVMPSSAAAARTAAAIVRGLP